MQINEVLTIIMSKLKLINDKAGDSIPTLPNWREFACGWGAAFINITIIYPLNKIIFRQMLHGVKMSSAFVQMRTEGLYYLYRGMLPPLCQKTFCLSVMFGVYDEVKRPLLANKVNKYVAKATGGMVAGTAEAVFMPFERIQTLLIDAKYHDHFRNTFHAFKVVSVNYGIRELYRGIVPIVLRNGPSNVGFFIMREEVALKLPKIENRICRSFGEFCSGAMIGVILSALFYPLNVVKVAMQSQLGGRHKSIVQVFQQVYRERNRKITNIYHGCFMNCTKAFIGWGVINTAYENLKVLVY